jgi:hypothetical protein
MSTPSMDLLLWATIVQAWFTCNICTVDVKIFPSRSGSYKNTGIPYLHKAKQVSCLTKKIIQSNRECHHINRTKEHAQHIISLLWICILKEHKHCYDFHISFTESKTFWFWIFFKRDSYCAHFSKIKLGSRKHGYLQS